MEPMNGNVLMVCVTFFLTVIAILWANAARRRHDHQVLRWEEESAVDLVERFDEVLLRDRMRRQRLNDELEDLLDEAHDFLGCDCCGDEDDEADEEYKSTEKVYELDGAEAGTKSWDDVTSELKAAVAQHPAGASVNMQQVEAAIQDLKAGGFDPVAVKVLYRGRKVTSGEGCDLDNDGDGNCQKHSDGCPEPASAEPGEAEPAAV